MPFWWILFFSFQDDCLLFLRIPIYVNEWHIINLQWDLGFLRHCCLCYLCCTLLCSCVLCLWFFEFGVICCVLFWEGSPHLWAIVWRMTLNHFEDFRVVHVCLFFCTFVLTFWKPLLLRFWESSLTLHPHFPIETFCKTIHVQNMCADHQSNNDNKNLEVFGNWTNDEMMFLSNKNKIFMRSENMKEKTIQRVDFSWIYWGAKKQLLWPEHRQIFMNDGVCVVSVGVMWFGRVFLSFVCVFLGILFSIVFVAHPLFSPLTQQSVGEDSLEFKVCLDWSENAQHRHTSCVSCCSEDNKFVEDCEEQTQAVLADKSIPEYHRSMKCWRLSIWWSHLAFQGQTTHEFVCQELSWQTKHFPNFFCRKHFCGQALKQHNQIKLYEHHTVVPNKGLPQTNFLPPNQMNKKFKKGQFVLTTNTIPSLSTRNVSVLLVKLVLMENSMLIWSGVLTFRCSNTNTEYSFLNTTHIPQHPRSLVIPITQTLQHCFSIWSLDITNLRQDPSKRTCLRGLVNKSPTIFEVRRYTDLTVWFVT